MRRESLGETGADVSAVVALSESITYDDRDDADIHVSRPSSRPLSMREEHARIGVHTDDADVVLELNGEELDALVDAVNLAQEFYLKGGPDE